VSRRGKPLVFSLADIRQLAAIIVCSGFFIKKDRNVKFIGQATAEFLGNFDTFIHGYVLHWNERADVQRTETGMFS